MIRAATPADAPTIAALCVQLGYPVTPEEAAQRLALFAGDTTSPVFVFDQPASARILAWMQLRVATTLESGPSAEIIGLVVDESARGQGIGAQLVTHARAWAKSHGLTRLRVRTNQTRTRTHAFYEGLGFTLTKSQRVYDAPV